MSHGIAGTRFTTGSFAPVAVAVRSDLDESLHYGAGVTLRPDGSISHTVGDPDVLIHPRSSLKPFQAAAMIRCGLELPPRLLAIVTASHSGEQRHLDAVTEVLVRHGLGVDDLANTPARPYAAAARTSARAAGVEPSPLQQNCSGKHAGMLATCTINGWSIDSYLDPDHPLQEAIADEIDHLAGRSGGSVVDVGVDGCGAPTFVMPLIDVARAAATLVRGGSDATAAMVAHPELVGGEDRDVSIWMEAVPGLVAKEGAAGAMVLALPDGSAAALKIADGSDAARQAVTVEMLRRLGVDVDGRFASARERVTVPVLGHGVAVGELRALAWG